MSLTLVQNSDGYEYVITIFGVTKRPKRDGRIPTTSAAVGEYPNGYDVSATFGGSSYRAKRKGRNPSTGFYPTNQTTGIVEDNYTLPSIGSVVEASIDEYKSLAELEEESES